MGARKIQRVDFCGSDWLGGTAALTLAQRGMFISICALIYVANGPITKSDLRKICPGRNETFNTLLLNLVEAGKITVKDGLIYNDRCMRELDRARRRIESNGDGSDSSFGNQSGPNDGSDSKPYTDRTTGESAPSPRKLNEFIDLPTPYARGTYQYEVNQREDIKKPNGVGRYAPAREAAPQPEPTAEEREAVSAAVTEATAALRGDVPKGIRDAESYKAAIRDRKFANALAAANRWAMRVDGAARLEAWEVVARGQEAGSWVELSIDDKRLLSRLYAAAARQERAERQQQAAA